MAEKNMVDLCKEALIKLADSKEPLILIEKAKEKAGEPNPNMDVGEKFSFQSFFHVVVEYKGWKILQHKLSFHYVLVDPEDIVRVKYFNLSTSSFKHFLETLSPLAPPPSPPKMIIYQLVTNKKVDVNKDCEVLTVLEANKRFPHSKDLASGFFTDHPVDELALVPVQNYFTNIALNQDDERVVLLGKMGAKSVHITKNDESKIKGKFDGKAGFENVNAQVGVSISSELQNFSELMVKFEGRVSDISPDILRNSVWFQNNGQMNAILEGRLSKNKVVEYDVTTRINQTFNFDFAAAANVLGVLKVSLENEYEKATKQSRRFHVIFGE